MAVVVERPPSIRALLTRRTQPLINNEGTPKQQTLLPLPDDQTNSSKKIQSFGREALAKVEQKKSTEDQENSSTTKNKELASNKQALPNNQGEQSFASDKYFAKKQSDPFEDKDQWNKHDYNEDYYFPWDYYYCPWWVCHPSNYWDYY
jgi:hypothetical protein